MRTGSLRHPTVGVPCCAASVLVHTDRCTHPRATEAMQILEGGRELGRPGSVFSCHGALSSALAS